VKVRIHILDGNVHRAHLLSVADGWKIVNMRIMANRGYYSLMWCSPDVLDIHSFDFFQFREKEYMCNKFSLDPASRKSRTFYVEG
jgi:hypothetical protein